MKILWIALAIPALLVLCWWEQLVAMAIERWLFRRNDDKPARRSLTKRTVD